MTSLHLLRCLHCYLLTSPPNFTPTARPGKVVPGGSTFANGKSRRENQALGALRSSFSFRATILGIQVLWRQVPHSHNVGTDVPDLHLVPVFGSCCTPVVSKIRDVEDPNIGG